MIKSKRRGMEEDSGREGLTSRREEEVSDITGRLLNGRNFGKEGEDSREKEKKASDPKK